MSDNIKTFKKVDICVWVTQEEYDDIPISEQFTNDRKTSWKTYDNVTFFNPRSAPSVNRTAVVYFEFKTYEGESYRVTVMKG